MKAVLKEDFDFGKMFTYKTRKGKGKWTPLIRSHGTFTSKGKGVHLLLCFKLTLIWS